MPTARLRRALAAGLIAMSAATAIGGCARTRVVGQRRSVGVVITEYQLKPSSIRAQAGLLTLIVHNYGARTHNLVVTLNGHVIGATKPLYPGQKQRIVVALLPGMHYTLASTILGDQSLGAYGTLDVP